MAMIFICFLVALVSGLTVLPADTSDITVNTTVGLLIGTKDEITIAGKDMKISRFLGIPYAEPPVGNRRFRVPIPKAPFTKPIVVQEFGNICLEERVGYTIVGSEDCLFLNIFVPDRNDIETLAVMVFLHGGGFIEGSGNYYIADILAAHGHVIVVTLNYRLSIWGFLSTEDSSSPGNYGLWDQRLAIKWVHDNIEAFGGDSNRITIFGESAGAGSVIYQGMFPQNQGLFQRLIAQSGSATVHWAYSSNPKQNAIKFATLVGCNHTNVNNMVDCLRERPASIINSALNNNPTEIMFVPSIDNVFVTCNPADIVNLDKVISNFLPARNTFASFDLLIGVNSGEGAMGLTPELIGSDPETFLPSKTFFDGSIVPRMVRPVFKNKLNQTYQAVVSAVVANYTDIEEPENPENVREQFLSLFGDANFLAPLHSTVDAHIAISTKMTYVYYFNVNPSYHALPTPTWVNKANHGDELMYLFPSNIPLGQPFDELETEVSKQMLSMWSNFAKTGNPNLPADFGINWPPYTDSTKSYLDITRNMSSANVREGFFESTGEFWNKVLPSIASVPDEECDFYVQTSKAVRISTYLSLSMSLAAVATFIISGPKM